MATNARILRSAIDPGFRWSATHRRLREIVEREKYWSGGINSYGYAVTMFASAGMYRDIWANWATSPSYEFRVHLTPMGTYFMFQGNSNAVDWSGPYVRADGTTGRFRGRYTYPLYCVGCGRADERVRQTVDCTIRTQVPYELLLLLPEREGVKSNLVPPAPATSSQPPQGLKTLPPVVSLAARQIRPLANVPPRQPAPWESLARSGAAYAWRLFKFVVLMLLLAIAAGRH